MSRGFVKEGDQEETIIIPPRAALPPGVTNYVTPIGLTLLRAEKDALERDLQELTIHNEDERRRAQTVIRGKLNLLQERILSARVLDTAQHPRDEIRFGATVAYRFTDDPTVHQFQIVGVDEANIQDKKIAFVAPIARALMGHKKGDLVVFELGSQKRQVEVLEISYSSKL